MWVGRRGDEMTDVDPACLVWDGTLSMTLQQGLSSAIAAAFRSFVEGQL